MLDDTYMHIERFKTGSFNLGVQLFCFGAPYPVKSTFINNKPYNLWTRDEFTDDITLKALVSQYDNVPFSYTEHGKTTIINVRVGLILHGTDIIYMYDGTIDANVQMRDILKTKSDACLYINLEPVDDNNEAKATNETVICCSIKHSAA